MVFGHRLHSGSDVAAVMWTRNFLKRLGIEILQFNRNLQLFEFQINLELYLAHFVMLSANLFLQNKIFLFVKNQPSSNWLSKSNNHFSLYRSERCF